jgi:hypothetical protein
LAKLQSDLREFIALLNSHAVDYLIVGGHAVAFHGHPRFTGDIDFFVRATAQNIERILAVLRAFGFGELGISVRDLLEPERVIQLGHPPNRIDIMNSVSGLEFSDAWGRRIQSVMDDQQVNLISWDDLLKNKRSSGRDKDLADVAKLVAVAKHRKPQ